MYRKPPKGPGVLHWELQHSISTTERLTRHTRRDSIHRSQGKSQYTEWYWRISELSHHGWIGYADLFFQLNLLPRYSLNWHRDKQNSIIIFLTTFQFILLGVWITVRIQKGPYKRAYVAALQRLLRHCRNAWPQCTRWTTFCNKFTLYANWCEVILHLK